MNYFLRIYAYYLIIYPKAKSSSCSAVKKIFTAEQELDFDFSSFVIKKLYMFYNYVCNNNNIFYQNM